MNTVIFRTIAPFLTALMMVFSVFVLLRGHNEPGGGFIGGLIGASALAIYGIACGVAPVRRAMVLHPMGISALGLLLSGLSGLPALAVGQPYLTALWTYPTVFGTELPLSTVLVFDIGVYLVVLGSITSILLGLEERDIDHGEDR
jgi:multicomponent Na+:H+ antiporter subunit B